MCVYIHNGILFSYKLLPFVTTWMGLEGIMLKWNVRQRKTNVVSMISFLFYFIFKLYIIVLVFAKYQNESATGIHVSPSWVPSGLTVRAAVISWLDGSNVFCLLIEQQYFSSHPCVGLSQERLVLSVLPRFVVLEMINDMTNVEDEHLQHQFHRIYIHRYENVRWATRPPPRSLPWLLSPHRHDFCLPKCQRLSSCDWLTH